MKMKAKKILFLSAFLLPVGLMAQVNKIKYRDRLGDTTVLVNTAVKPAKIKGPAPLRGELSGGFRLNSDGYAVFVDKGWLRGGEQFGQNNADRFYHVRLLQVELSERKHPKEMRSNGGLGAIGMQSSSYILGKINNFYTLRIGYGRRQMIAGKPDPGAISVHWVYLGGFSAGLVKPYYLKLHSLGETKYADSIARYFIAPGNIVGRSGFNKGLNEIKFVPGAYVKSGLHFDFASRRKGLIALEVGASAEFYTQKIEQMVAQDPKSLFFNFYASLQIGKRW
jgi:hypothetical protein